MNRPFAAACVAGCLLSAHAHAEAPVPAAAAPEPAAPHRIALTFSPVHLFFTFVELQAELRVTPKLGFALILGAGGTTDDWTGAEVHAVSVGMKGAWYAVGDFEEGMQVALEVMDIAASASLGDLGAAFGDGFTISPFIGYKDTLCFGLTFEVQAGPGVVFVGDEVSLIPNVNLNLGWSF